MPKTLIGFSSIPVLVCVSMDWIYIFVHVYFHAFVYQQYMDIVNLVWGSKKFFSVKRVNWVWGGAPFSSLIGSVYLSLDYAVLGRILVSFE